MVESKGVTHAFDGAEVWKGTSTCNSDRAMPRRTTQTFDRLVGYSLGRLGPAYYLQQREQHHTVGAVRSVVILDPGAGDVFDCDRRSGAGYTYATWMRQNPANRLLIITAEASARDGYRALQDVYASKLGGDVAARVLICDAPAVKHANVPTAFKALLSGTTATACPSGTTLNRYSPRAPAPAAPQFHVHNTCADGACGLVVETAPGSRFGGVVIGSLPDGTAVTIRCQAVGGP